MTTIKTKRPSKDEQLVATKSYNTLSAALELINTPHPEIEIEETKQRIKIPISALRLLADILDATSKGKPISLVPVATEMTTQKAAEFLGCSRPHIVKLLESGDIDFIKVGRHRRVKFEDLMKYKMRMKEKQKRLLAEMMHADEKLGLYDS